MQDERAPSPEAACFRGCQTRHATGVDTFPVVSLGLHAAVIKQRDPQCNPRGVQRIGGEAEPLATSLTIAEMS